MTKKATSISVFQETITRLQRELDKEKSITENYTNEGFMLVLSQNPNGVRFDEPYDIKELPYSSLQEAEELAEEYMLHRKYKSVRLYSHFYSSNYNDLLNYEKEESADE